MSRIPPDDELEREFGRYLDDPGVLAVTCWNQPDANNPCHEETCLARSESNTDVLGMLLSDERFHCYSDPFTGSVGGIGESGHEFVPGIPVVPHFHGKR